MCGGWNNSVPVIFSSSPWAGCCAWSSALYAAAFIWLVNRQDWARSLKIGILFIVSALCLVLYGGSLSFAVFYLPLALINPAVYCFSVSKVE